MPTSPTPSLASAPARRLRAVSLAGLTAAALLLALWLLLGAAQPPAWAGGNYAILQTYPNPTPASGGEDFGYSLAYLSGANRLIIGSRGDSYTSTAGGLVFVLNATTGSVQHVLHSPAPVAGDQFGFSVGAVLTAVVVGAPRVDVNGVNTNEGAAYLFDALTGNLIFAYPHPQPVNTDLFGSSVAIISDTVIIGVPQYDVPSTNSNSGRVYLCSMTTGACPTAIDNPSTGAAGWAGRSRRWRPGSAAAPR